MKRAEEVLYVLVLVVGGYSGVAALVALVFQEWRAMVAYLVAAAVCLVVVPAVRTLLFGWAGIPDDEDEEALR